MTFKKTNKFLTYLLLFLTFFLLWIWYSYYFLQNSQNIIVKKEKEIVIEKEKNITELNLEKYNKVYGYIKEMYYDFDEVKSEDLVESSIDWLVKWLKDPHTEYFSCFRKSWSMSKNSFSYRRVSCSKSWFERLRCYCWS